MSQNRAPHSARYSWIPQNCGPLSTPYNDRGATMAMRGTRYNTREEIIPAVGRSLLDINRSGRADGV
jgi:hypothetical protein